MRTLSLRPLLVGTTVVLVAAALVLVGTRAVALLQRLADDQALARVRPAGAAAVEAVERTGQNVLTNARLLAERPTLHRYVSAGQDAALRDFLGQFAATGGAAGCAVLANGRLVAGGSDLPWETLAAGARAGDEGWFLEEDPAGGPLLLVGATRVEVAPGALALTVRRLDSLYADQVTKRVGLPVRVVSRAAALAAPDDPRAALRRAALDPGTPDAARLDREGAFVSTHPIRGRAGATVGVVETSLDTAAVDASVRELVRSLAWTTLVVTAAAGLLAFLLARRIAGPLESLTRAAYRIGRGDLGTPVPRAGGAETGVLADTMEDMRERLLRAAGELRRGQAEAEAILGGVVEGVFAVDRERRISYVNPQAATMLGVRVGDAIGRFCGDVLRPEGTDGTRPCEERCPILDARFRGDSRATEHLRLAGGRRRTVVITSAAPGPSTPDEAETAVRQFQVMRDETEEDAARRLRDTVLANVSHEFRTPLSAQLASLEMLRDRLRQRDDDPHADELVRSVERAALRLVRLVDNLLESLRIEAGRDSIRLVPVSLEEVVEEAVQLTASLIQQKDQHLEIDLPYPLPGVTGDPPRLAQALVNLLANANKFAPAGTRIAVGGEVHATEVALWVEDEGPGLPADAGDRLFERFLRAPGEEPEESGMGLGLWIVHSIVGRHGGRVEARNTGHGARFTVVLSRADAPGTPGPADPPA